MTAVRFVAALILEWAMMVASLAVACRWPFALPLCVFVVGIRQHAVGILAHDAAHGHGGRLGVALAGPLGFWPLGVGLAGYRTFHWRHHRGVGRSTDPEMPIRRRQEARNDRIGVARAAVLDLVGAALVDVTMIVRAMPPASVLDVVGPLVLHAAFITLAPWPAIVGWYVAMGTSFMAAFRLRAATEHLGTFTLSQSRPALWRRALYLPHCTWRHYEHHKRPGIPTWRL